MTALRDRIRHRLEALAEPEVRDKLTRLVPGAKALGVKVPDLRELAKEIATELRGQHGKKALDAAGDLMDELCAEQCREEMLVGIFVLGRLGKAIEGLEWRRLERWVGKLDNWETCDQLASGVSGPLIAANLHLVDRLIALTEARDPWTRRFAIATASELNHRGRSHPLEALRVCQPLLDDPARTVRQAVGWAIREASKKDEMAVFELLRRHRRGMRLAVLKEASSKLSADQRARLLAGL
jgi:3-methyladenine DNA glycosylase AlkD